MLLFSICIFRTELKNFPDMPSNNKTIISSTNFTYDQVLSPIFAATFQGIVAIGGLIGYMLFLTTIIKNRKEFFKNNFWILAVHLLFPDCFILLTVIVYEVPCVYHQTQVYGTVVGDIFSRSNSLLYYTVMVMMLSMSFERFVKVVIQGSLAKKVNSLLFVHISATISWLVGLIVLLLSLHFKCHKSYLQYVYRYYIYCDNEQGFVALASTAGFCLGSLAVLYTAILVYMRLKTIEVRFLYSITLNICRSKTSILV